MATLSVSPQWGTVTGAGLVNLRGTGTTWTEETASTLFSVSGGSSPTIGATVVVSDTYAIATLHRGAAIGTLTIEDTSTSATAAFRVKRRAVRWFPQLTRRSESGDSE